MLIVKLKIKDDKTFEILFLKSIPVKIRNFLISDSTVKIYNKKRNYLFK